MKGVLAIAIMWQIRKYLVSAGWRSFVLEMESSSRHIQEELIRETKIEDYK